MVHKLIICGIPGTGKSTIGDYIGKKNEFIHLNLEDAPVRNEFLKDPELFINRNFASNKSVVVTWGFLPDDIQTELVLRFKNTGYKLIWFDGNRPAARKHFIIRNTVPVCLFDIQIKRIDDCDVLRKINPMLYDTFNGNGKFKSKKRIANDLLGIE